MTLGELTISGWIYDIANGQVSIAENSDPTFTPLT